MRQSLCHMPTVRVASRGGKRQGRGQAARSEARCIEFTPVVTINEPNPSSNYPHGAARGWGPA
jgi:hypothetical protein